MIATKTKIQNRIVFYDLPVMFCGDLVLVMFVIAFLAKINFLCETVHISLLILTFLALDEFSFLVLLFSERELD